MHIIMFFSFSVLNYLKKGGNCRKVCCTTAKQTFRKHPDMTFSKTLPDGFCENPLLHAYLYVSADKTDRCHTALLIAKSLLCTERNEHALPCGKCSDCIKMESRSHPDCFFFGSDGAKVSVDDIRTISERAYLAPNEASGKVFILEEADTYNTQAQNALLKILEEPPKNVYFILTASSKNAPVKSRWASGRMFSPTWRRILALY